MISDIDDLVSAVRKLNNLTEDLSEAVGSPAAVENIQESMLDLIEEILSYVGY